MKSAIAAIAIITVIAFTISLMTVLVFYTQDLGVILGVVLSLIFAIISYET